MTAWSCRSCSLPERSLLTRRRRLRRNADLHLFPSDLVLYPVKLQPPRCLIIALVVLPALGAPATARAQGAPSHEPNAPAADSTGQKARDLMRTGFGEYKKGHYEAAREAFAQAWELQHEGIVAGALAEVEMRLSRYGDAAEHWEEYLETDPPDRAQAQAQLDECKKRVSRVRITLYTWEDLFVDGVAKKQRWSFGFHGGRVLWLSPGLHSFEARDQEEPHKVERRELEVVLGQEHDIEFRPFLAPPRNVAPAPAAAPPPTARRTSAAPQPKSAYSHTRTIVTVAGAVLTVGAATFGVVSGLGAKAAEDRRAGVLADLQRTAPPGTSSSICDPVHEGYAMVRAQCAEIRSEVESHDSLANRANVSFIVAGALGVATIATFLLWPKRSGGAEHGDITILPLPISGSRGVAIEATF